MRRCELCGELFPEEELRNFIRFPGRYVQNIACKKCIEEHSIPVWARSTGIVAVRVGLRGDEETQIE